MVTIDDVRRIALALPATVEKTSYGTTGFRVKDRLFARLRPEGDALVVYVWDVAEKDAIIAAAPAKYFTLPHYNGHASVLVRMEAVDDGELQEMLTESWRVRAPARLRAAFDAT